MEKDNLDTVAMEDHTQWASTQVEDVFLPTVRVQLAWADVEAAVQSGAIVPTQAHGLWAAWAAPGSENRVGNTERRPDFEPPSTPPPAFEKPWVPEQPATRPGNRTARGGSMSLSGALGLFMAFLLGAVVVYVALSL